MTLAIPACSFLRVFDTAPEQEVLTLPELTAALRRFEVKTETAKKIEREVARIEAGAEALRRGEAPRGKFMGKLAKAAQKAKKAGADEREAIEREAAAMIVEARKSAKRDLRLWSPALYRPGADKRGSENVTHVSCLVLDYDDGTPIAEASATFGGWFHIVYTTWSHTAEHHRFRLVLPLAFSVMAEDWSKVWSWAEELARFEIDPAMKSPAATYALPAVPHRAWPREAFSRPGAILDPVDEGILDRASALELEPHRPRSGAASAIRGEDPEKEYIDHDDPDAVYVMDDEWDHELDWEAPEELVQAVKAAAGVTSGAPASVPATASDSNEEFLAKTQRRKEDETNEDVRSPSLREGSGEGLRSTSPPLPEGGEPSPPATDTELEPEPVVGGSVVDALERLAALHREGVLSDDELRVAKRRVLDGDPRTELARVGPGAHRRTLCVDFDGVIHSYSSGWKGATTIPDPPVEGAIRWLEQASERFDLAIHTVRAGFPGAIEAMRHWLRGHGLSDRALERMRFPLHKPPAVLYIDDRAYRFEGTFPSFEELGALSPWNHPRR